MIALRGADALERAFSVATQPRVVCIKFRSRSPSPTGVVSPLPSLPSSPISEDFRSNVHKPLVHVDSATDLKQTVEQEERGEGSGECAHDRHDSYKGEGEWVILDMLDDHGEHAVSLSEACNKVFVSSAFSSILRILHREASHPMSSSFAPSSSIIAVSPQSPVVTSIGSYEMIPYPEWRIHTVENARKAGMGDVGKPMAWVLWTEKGLGESLMGNIRHYRQAFLQEMGYRTVMIPSDIYGSDDESDEESEMEWEGWMRDLERQSRVKQRSDKVGRSAVNRQVQTVASMSSSPPSPPLSKASSSRVRSTSLPKPQVVTGSLGAYPHAQYPNIGNIIGGHERCGEVAYTPEKIKSTTVRTVSVGMVPSSRPRSSTVSTEVAMTKHGKGQKERFSSISPNDSRANMRAVSSGSPGTAVRHAHSSSNLRTASSLCESDVSHPVSPLKRHGGFMRGVSQRAGRLVRGLESAIDFVDEKTSLHH